MNRFLAMDFEGTAKEPRQGYPAQLGIALFENEIVTDQMEILMRQPRHYKSGKPTKTVDANSLAIWGMTLDRLEERGVSIDEGCDRLSEFIDRTGSRNLAVVAFNVSYDLECYRQMLFEAGEYDRSRGRYEASREILSNRWCCAYGLARRKLPSLSGHSLDDVAAYFGLSRETGEHGAEEDAILAGKVWIELNRVGVDEVFQRNLIDVSADEAHAVTKGAYTS